MKWKQLKDKLLQDYQPLHRPLPWRGSQNPYWIWISEVMSQQSVMKSVIPYFERWIQKFPTLEDLAQSEESEVLAAWAGLGYYSRARNIHAGARYILEFKKKWGRLPRSVEEWLEVKGVGPYTAAAIASLAFQESVLGVDGNVIRVLARLLGVEDPLNSKADRLSVEEAARALAQTAKGKEASLLQEALMDLGSQICRPNTEPLCRACAWKKDCQAFRDKRTSEIPFSKKRKLSEKWLSLMLLYKNKNGQFAVRKIPREASRLAGQWELPHWDFPIDPDLREKALSELKENFELIGPVHHNITHHQYEVYGVQVGSWKGNLEENHVFLSHEAPTPQLVLTSMTKKLLAQL